MEKVKLMYGARKQKIIESQWFMWKICSTSHRKSIPEDRELLRCHIHKSRSHNPATYLGPINPQIDTHVGRIRFNSRFIWPKGKKLQTKTPYLQNTVLKDKETPKTLFQKYTYLPILLVLSAIPPPTSAFPRMVGPLISATRAEEFGAQQFSVSKAVDESTGERILGGRKEK